MKRQTDLIIMLVAITLLAFTPGVAQAAPMGNAFTYQGRLTHDGGPANGTYDFLFTLYDAVSGGSQVGPQLTIGDISVSQGLFTVSLNFGSGIFTGDARWLQISVRPGGSSSFYVNLSPRQILNPTPYAVYAPSAGTVGSVPWSSLTSIPAGFADGTDNDTLYSAGTGLSINGTQFSVSYGGTGAANTAARSDHNHDVAYVNVIGDSMSGNSGAPILSVSNTSTGAGAYGIDGSTASTVNGVAGVRGSAGVAGTTIVGKHGVLGQSDTGKGVVGISRDSYGTYGWSTNGWGVRGEGNDGGVFGYSWTVGSTAVRGENTASSGQSYGVNGVSNSTGGGAGVQGDGAYVGVWGKSSGAWGVYGNSTGTSMSYGIYGDINDGIGNYAGYFSGPVYVSGVLTKAGGGFKIDHPLDPENKYLYHSFVESPDMMNIYNGNVVLDGEGRSWVELPNWMEALNRDFRYQLTAIGGPGPNLYVSQKVQNHRFQIAGGAPGLEVSWQVTGIRHDPYAEAHRIPVEEEKLAEFKDTYLQPSAYGKPKSMGSDHRSRPIPKPTTLRDKNKDLKVSEQSATAVQSTPE